MAIDPVTYGRFVEAVNAARERGLSLAEALDYRRLLLTEKRERDIAVDSLENALRRLNLQSPNRLMSFYYNRVDGTPSEMFDAVKMWLETVCRRRSEGTLEDL